MQPTDLAGNQWNICSSVLPIARSEIVINSPSSESIFTVHRPDTTRPSVSSGQTAGISSLCYVSFQGLKSLCIGKQIVRRSMIVFCHGFSSNSSQTACINDRPLIEPAVNRGATLLLKVGELLVSRENLSRSFPEFSRSL